MRVGWLYSPRFLDHGEPGHPERPDRLRRVLEVMDETGLRRIVHDLELDPIDEGFLTRVHQPTQIQRIREVARGGGGHVDPDTYVGPDSFEIARLAAGAATGAVDAVWDGKVDRAFAALRPPGHHATGTHSMGFCLFNNVALAAARALDRGARRVLIVDWDVHHGNGTHDIFYEDPRVLFVSSHQVPLYPGTGLAHETGRGDGAGWTVNIPLPAGVGDRGLHRAYEEIVDPIARRARPDIILVSAGYDAHFRDPLAGLTVSTPGFHGMARFVTTLADDLCQGRLVVCLEGGYDLDGVAWSTAATVAALAGVTPPEDPMGLSDVDQPDLTPLLAELRQRHGL